MYIYIYIYYCHCIIIIWLYDYKEYIILSSFHVNIDLPSMRIPSLPIQVNDSNNASVNNIQFRIGMEGVSY